MSAFDSVWREQVRLYHQCVNEAVQHDCDPHRWTHVADTTPQTQYDAGVVIRLQAGALFTLCKDDQSVQHFVELAEVEDPGPKRNIIGRETPKSIAFEVDQGLAMQLT